MKVKLGLGASCLGMVALFLTSGVGFTASYYYGNNAYTKYRLPWQHGQWHYMSQGYLEGNHGGWGGQYYSLDFPMNTGTPVLTITEGSACLVREPNGSGLGNYAVEMAPAHSGSGTDYYFYGHLSDSWLPACTQGSTPVYEGQISSWSGDTGVKTGPHLHVTVQNPGNACYCGSVVSVKFPPLSGIDFDGKVGNYGDTYTSDSAMPGDDNALPQPNWYANIFNNWSAQGGVTVAGVPFDNAGGPGVHVWGPGLVQDFAEPSGYGIIMQYYGASVAYRVHGAIRDAYFSQFGGWATLGYPVSDEYQWGSYRRSDFQYGSICASFTSGTSLCDPPPPAPTPTNTPANPPAPTATPIPSQPEVLRPTANGTYLEWGELWGSGTTHWDRVADVTPDDSGSYIMDNTWSGTERDTFQLSDTSFTSISSVEVVARAARITTNDNNNVRLFIRSGTVDAESAVKPLSTSWDEVSQVWTADPATGGAWTQAAVNALQAGVRNAMGPSGGGGVGVTQVYVVVRGT
ncbi:MAG: hypothetical protein KGK07_12935 [Chloroflexota bacterium]|nr:hypothetical protein [Chloroflexota bacterium]